MEINFETNSITIFNKKAKLDAIISKFTTISGDQLSHFLKNRTIKVPRKLHMLALMKVLNKKVKTLMTDSLSNDFFIRLQYYKDFTEEQYCILFDKIAANDEKAFLEYRYTFVNLIFLNYVALDFNDGEINYIRSIGKEKMEDFSTYARLIDGACIDQEDTFDGQSIDVCKKTLHLTAPGREIRLIAKKYNLIIPSRLNKEELLLFIKDYLGNKLIAKDYEALSMMSLSKISEFCKQVNIPMSAALTKTELVTYLFYLLKIQPVEKSSIKELFIPDSDEYKPFIFTVDLEAIPPFGKGEPKKLIHYEGEENDIENDANIKLIDDDPNSDEDVAVVPLAQAEDANPVEEENLDEPEENLNEPEEENLDEPEEENPDELEEEIPEDEALEEEIPLEETPEEAEEENPKETHEEENLEETPEEEPKEELEEDEVNILSDTESIDNDQFGSMKIEKSGKKLGKIIGLSIALALALGLIAIVIIFILI